MNNAMNLWAMAISLGLGLTGCGDDGPVTDAAVDSGDPDVGLDSSLDSNQDVGLDGDVEAPVLSGLFLDRGVLSPPFDPAITSYSKIFGALVTDVRVRPSTETASAIITVDGTVVASGAFSDPITLDVGTTTVEVIVAAASMSATYTIVIERASPGLYLKASNTGAGDGFGTTVAVSGDTLVVGAPGEDSSAMGIDGDDGDNSAGDSGAVYVFRNDGGTWAQEAYIKASDSTAGDTFGAAVDIDGDVMVVGADRRLSVQGAAYIFRRTGTTWAEEATLVHPAPDDGDNMGSRVTIDGDVVAIAVHADGSASSGIDGDPADNSLPASGAVLVFRRSGTDWNLDAYIKASTAGGADRFGRGVDLEGNTLIVAAPTEDSSATGVDGNESSNAAVDAGAAYIFTYDGTNWAQQAYLKASNTAAGDIFGVDVTVSGDWAAVGAQFEDSNAVGVNGDQTNDGMMNAGAVYVFRRSGTTWSQQAYIKASNTAPDDQFGWRVALDGDLLTAAAYFEDSNASGLGGDETNDSTSNAGAVYVLRWSGVTWEQQHYVKASNTGADDTFGFSLDMDAGRLVVATRGEDSSATGVGGNGALDDAPSSGAAYVY